MESLNRVVVLVDMDCFYCQVEEKLDPNLTGKPIAVVQYNAWRGGGIIAVNYPARDRGVTRHMQGDEAKAKCPEIALCRVPQVRGKADLSKYREAGKQVAEVLQTFTGLLERASVDEAYLDITEAVKQRIEAKSNDLNVDNMANTFVVGFETEHFINNVKSDPDYNENNLKLAIGGLITEEIRKCVFEKTGYRCSAGIAHNKILAKLVCGLHKPNKQTMLPQESVVEFFQSVPLRKIKSLGGKFGNTLSEDLGIVNMSELAQFSEKDLIQRYDERNGTWLYNIARGINNDPVTTRLTSKSIGCCKKFPGKNALIKPENVQHWLNELAEEIAERLQQDLEENHRKAKQMIVSFVQEINRKDVSSSRTLPLNSYDQKRIAQCAYDTIKRFCLQTDGNFCLKFLGISVGHFEDFRKVREITSFFTKRDEKTDKNSVYSAETDESDEQDNVTFYDDKYRVKTEKETNSLPSTSSSSFFQKYLEKYKENIQTKEQTENEMDSNCFQDCSECNKKIPITEYESHKDYHFALKLVKEQTIEMKKTQVENKKSSKKSPRKNKRKADNNTNLLSFLKKGNEGTETCTECNRKLMIDEIECHMDYHTAKKLHLEINKPAISNNKQTKNLDKRKKTNDKKIKSVASFFKPL